MALFALTLGQVFGMLARRLSPKLALIKCIDSFLFVLFELQLSNDIRCDIYSQAHIRILRLWSQSIRFRFAKLNLELVLVVAKS